ncbi:polyphosphate:AMP phosphotransferase [Arhodomonas sp. SL1]|uniref:polyphosphate:AMP phosphotransferase n=1 Tax=Arhodomonas sp. SL1 TaxID=3425691 RepID=UPI003F885A64
MFETAEIGRRIDRDTYHRALPRLRRDLIDLQEQLQRAHFPVIVLLEGVDNAVKGELINTLGNWLDSRAVDFTAFGAKTDEERSRPRFWRYWRGLPAAGRIGVFHSSWYSGTLIQRALHDLPADAFEHHMHRINALEALLSREGALLLKFWLHMSAERQRAYFEALARDPRGRWLTSELDRRLNEQHEQACAAGEWAIHLTDHASAPWIVVEAQDSAYRNLTVGHILRDGLQQRLDVGPEVPPQTPVPAADPVSPTDTVLQHLDLRQHLDKPEYRRHKRALGRSLTAATWRAHHHGVSLVVVLEGWDAAGKGGAIRRLLQGIDARLARVIQVGPPSDEERAHPYLWRFWRHLPRDGHVTIYDRSWYGRVLVERVRGLTPEARWREAYAEINDFEDQLIAHGTALVKCFLHIDADEQLRRFRARQRTPHKRHKLTDEDWEDRALRPDYEKAVHEMVTHTSTGQSPWHLIAANDKRHARVEVMRHVLDTLQQRLGPEARP